MGDKIIDCHKLSSECFAVDEVILLLGCVVLLTAVIQCKIGMAWFKLGTLPFLLLLLLFLADREGEDNGGIVEVVGGRVFWGVE